MIRLAQFAWILLAFGLALPAQHAAAQIDPVGRPISEIRVEGLQQVPEQLVRNQIRSEINQPYDPDVVANDLVRITHLGGFETVTHSIEPQPDNSLTLIFELQEQPLLADLQIVGNRHFNDQALIDEVELRPGDTVERFLIDQGARHIEQRYRERGFFGIEVEHDEELLQQERVLIYQLREGPRARIREIRIQGNETYTNTQLRAQIESRDYIPVFRRGHVDRQRLELDAAALRTFYRERGFLEAEVAQRLELTPDHRHARVSFAVVEGPRYTVDRVRIDDQLKFPDAQILRHMTLRSGDIFTEDARQTSEHALRDLYGRLGYLESEVRVERVFHEDQPRVDLFVEVREGIPSTVGRITLRGNEHTQDRVALREIRGLEPGRRFDRTGLEQSERRLNQSPAFGQTTITVLGQPEDEFRDVIIELEERDTGEIGLGAAVSTDLGLMGNIVFTERNFDIANFPTSWRDVTERRAFRGAGQFLQLRAQPGTEFSEYALSFREPALFESDYFLTTTAHYRDRQRREHDEKRYGGSLGIGQHFGDVWSGELRARAERVEIRDVRDNAPFDIFDVRGKNSITGLRAILQRSTIDNIIFPTEGSRSELSVERVGALGGDFDFTTVELDFRQFWTVHEDFFNRRSVLSWRLNIGHILESDEAPTFERFHAGGHRSMRGFEFRGVGPQGRRPDGTLTNYSVGGEFMFVTSLQYEFPIAGRPQPGQHSGVLNGVVFTDMGTLRNSPGLSPWRMSAGAGLRIQIPFLGQAPFAIDFAYPIQYERGDQRQIISFDLALPLP